ncbi:MAG: hypothetical protein KF823_11760 [Xanthomonadales bacterium]|nr:hypothetical protein [Xanthomonadales bacterium]
MRPHPVAATIALAVAVLLTKLAVLALDPEVRFFFGDSGSYVHAALTGWVPPDRSPTYPLLVASMGGAGGLWRLVLVQSAIGALSCLLVWSLLVGPLRVRPALAAAAALLLALEPMQLYYERSVMAETAGTACLLAMLAALAATLHQRRPVWLAAAAALGVAAVSLRVSLLPVVLVLGALAPLLWLVALRPARPTGPALLSWLVLAVTLTIGAHHAYRSWYGTISGGAPAWIADEPWFRLGWLAPLVRPDHLTHLGLPPDLLDRVGPSLGEPRAREAQIWSPDGLVNVLRQAGGEQGPRIAGKIVKRIQREHPLAIVRLGLSTVADHFDAAYARDRMGNDLGRHTHASAAFIARVREHYDHDASDWRHDHAPVARAFEAARLVYTLALLMAFPAGAWLLWLAWRRRDPVAALPALALLGLATAYVLFSHILVYRYLHPLVPVLLVTLAVLADRLGRSSGSSLRS